MAEGRAGWVQDMLAILCFILICAGICFGIYWTLTADARAKAECREYGGHVIDAPKLDAGWECDGPG